jgi:hypothetical protein
MAGGALAASWPAAPWTSSSTTPTSKSCIGNWHDHFHVAEDVEQLRSLCLWLGLTGRLGTSSVEGLPWEATTLGEISALVTSGSRGWKE